MASTRSSSSGILNSYYSYVCVECGEFFLTDPELKQHEISIHSGHRIECDRCGAGFRSKATFGDHICQLLLGTSGHVVTSGRAQRSLSLDSSTEHSVTGPIRRSRRLSSQTKRKSIDVPYKKVEDSVDENRILGIPILNFVPNPETEEITEFDTRFDKSFSEQDSDTIPFHSGQTPLSNSFSGLSIDDGTSRLNIGSKRKRLPESAIDESDISLKKAKMPDLGFPENDEPLMNEVQNYNDQNDDDNPDDSPSWKRILLGESFVYLLSQVVQQKQQQQQQNISAIGNSGSEETKNLLIETQIPIVISESDLNYLISHSASIPMVGLEKSSDSWLLKSSTSTFVPDPKESSQMDHYCGDDEKDEEDVEFKYTGPIANCLKPNKSEWNCHWCFHLLKEGTPTELQTHLHDHIDNSGDDAFRPVAPALEVAPSPFWNIRMPNGSVRRVTPHQVYEMEMPQDVQERPAKVAKRRSSRRAISWN